MMDLRGTGVSYVAPSCSGSVEYFSCRTCQRPFLSQLSEYSTTHQLLDSRLGLLFFENQVSGYLTRLFVDILPTTTTLGMQLLGHGVP